MSDEAKNKGGRPRGLIQDRPFQMRVNDEFLAVVDEWRAKQPDKPPRATAIRRMVYKAAGKRLKESS